MDGRQREIRDLCQYEQAWGHSPWRLSPHMRGNACSHVPVQRVCVCAHTRDDVGERDLGLVGGSVLGLHRPQNAPHTHARKPDGRVAHARTTRTNRRADLHDGCVFLASDCL
jgi:hypothetical protein